MPISVLGAVRIPAKNSRISIPMCGDPTPVSAVFLAEQLGDLTPGFPGSSPAPDLFQVRPKRRLYAAGLGFFITQF